MAASFAFKLAGVEPPGYMLRPDLHAAFWRTVVALGLEVKDRELAAGLDAFGQPLAAISQYTREHRKSAMGPADPNAPPLTPAYGLSRTRSLLDGRAHARDRYALFFWRSDPVTGQSWGKILGYHRVGGGKLPVRDVIGLSPAGRTEVERRARAWWEQRVKHNVPIPTPVKVPTPAGATLIKTIPQYQPKNPANAVPEANRRISLTQIGENVYTHQGGSTAAIKKAVANQPESGFSGFKRRLRDAEGNLTATGRKAYGFFGTPPPTRPVAPPPPKPPPAGRGAGPKPKPRAPAPKKPPAIAPPPAAPASGPVDFRELGTTFKPSRAARGQAKRTVVIDVAKIDAAWQRDKGFYVPPGGIGEGAKPGAYARAAEFIARAIADKTPIEQSDLSLDARGTISFEDGRHRFAVLRDLGVINLPVSVFRYQAARLLRLFGWVAELAAALGV